MPDLQPPPGSSDDWIALVGSPLPVDLVSSWLVRPDCGATVVFFGTARDHSGDRSGVDLLTYEAYDTYAEARLAEVVTEARARWPRLGRLAVLHRSGDVALGEAAVVVGASAGHRDTAFDGARFCIDAVKATVPIWKKERWADGEEWGLDGSELVNAAAVVSPPAGTPGEAR